MSRTRCRAIARGKGGSLGACTPPGIQIPTVMVPKFTNFVDFP